MCLVCPCCQQERADFSQLETEYNEKKSVYENTAVGLDADRDKLAAEVTAYQVCACSVGVLVCVRVVVS